MGAMATLIATIMALALMMVMEAVLVIQKIFKE
jgi:hypothetical protein